MRSRTVLAALLVTAALAVPAGAVINQNNCPSTNHCVLKITRSVPHATFWTQAFDVANSYTMKAGSWFNSTAWYVSPDFNNPPFDNTPASRAGIMIWVERDRGTSLSPQILFGVTTWVQGFHPVVHGHTDIPIDVTVEPQAGGPQTLAGVAVSILLNGNINSLPAGTYRLVILAPEATQINNQLYLLTNRLASTTDARQTFGSAGKLVAWRDWDAEQRARTEGFELLRNAVATHDVPSGRLLYGFFGPATSGINAAPGVAVGGFGTTWGQSKYRVEPPTGPPTDREVSYPVCTNVTCPGGPSGSTPLVFNWGPAGTWTLRVERHAAAGLTPDMIAILADIPVAS